MVHPLVQNGQRPLDRCKVGDTVLSEHSHPEGIDQIRDAMMDLRINVIGTACENDPMPAGLLQIFKNLLAFIIDRLPCTLQLCPSCVDCAADLISRNIRKEVYELFLNGIPVGKCNEGAVELNVQIPQILYIVLDVHRIGGDDGAVIVIARVLELLSLVRHARIEDPFDSLCDQPLDMTVCDLGRVAFRFRGDRFDAQLIDPVGSGR